MSTGKTIFGVLLLILLVGYWASTFLLEPAQQPDTARPQPAAQNEAPQPRARTPDLVPEREAAITDEPELAPDPDPATSSALVRPRLRWELEGTLVGLHPKLPWSSKIHVSGQSVEGDATQWFSRIQASGKLGDGESSKRSAPVTEDGKFRVDIDDWLGAGSPLEIVADDPWYMPVRVQVDPFDGAPPPPSPEPVLVEIAVTPAGVLTGSLFDEKGPAVGATALLFPIPNGEQVLEPIDRDVSDSKGRYRLRVSEPGNYAVVAYGPGLPAAELCGGSPHTMTQVPDLRLDRGSSVSGRVTGSWGVIEAAVIRVSRPEKGDTRLVDDGTVFVWNSGSPYYYTRLARTADTGRYEIQGLDPTLHAIRLLDVPGAEFFPTLAKELTRPITPSAEGVDFDVQLPYVTVRVSTNPKIRGSTAVSLTSGEDSIELLTDELGYASFFVQPEHRYALSVTMEPFEPHHESIQMPAGRQRMNHGVLLGPAKTHRVVLVVEGEGSQEPKFAEVEFVTPWNQNHSWRYVPSPWEPSFHGPVHLKGGTVSLGKLPRGSYRVNLQPLDTEADAGFWIPVSRAFQVTDGPDERVNVRTRRGGIVEVVLEQADWLEDEIQLTLMDKSGRAVPITGAPTGSGSELTLHARPPRTLQLRPAVPPGDWLLHVSARGAQSQQIPVKVRRLEVTQVKVALSPR